MKKHIFSLIIFTISLTIYGQWQMYVWQNGSKTKFAVNGIDSITFKKEQPINEGDPGFEEFVIYKFKKHEYKDYILTNKWNDYFSINIYPNVLPDGCWENMQGKCPYHELKQGYVLLDWRWTQCNIPVIILEHYSTQQSWNQIWALNTPHDDNPIIEEYSIAIENFDLYTGDIKYNSLYYVPYITHYFSKYYSQQIKDSILEYPPTNLDYMGDMSLEELEDFYDSYYQNIIHRLDSIIEIKSFVEMYEEIY